MACEAAFGAREHRLVRRPWPAAEARTLVIGKRLMDLIARVHDKRSVLRNRLADGLALQQQKLAGVGTIFKRDVAGCLEVNGNMAIERLILDPHRTAAEKIQRATGAGSCCG